MVNPETPPLASGAPRNDPVPSQDLRAYDAWKGQNADKNASLWLRPCVRAQLKNVGAVLNWASSDKKITYVHLPLNGYEGYVG